MVRFFRLLPQFLFVVLVTFTTAEVRAADRTIGIIVFDNVLTSDIVAPAEVFGIASRKAWFSNYRVIMIGVERKDKITTEEGITLVVDATIYDDLDLDVLLVPSAYDMDPLLGNADLTAFLKTHGEKVTWLASNCSGAFLLANAGLLDGLNATTWAGGEGSLQDDYPRVKVVVDRNVVVDGNRITSNGSVVSYQAALVLLSKVASDSRAIEVFETLQLERVIDWNKDVVRYSNNYSSEVSQ